MKTFFFLLITVFCFTVLIAQKNSNTELKWEDALKQAKKDNKIVMAVIDASECDRCNEMAILGLNNDLVKRSVANSCVLIKLKNIPAPVTSSVSLFFLPASFFGVIFFDADSNVLDVYNGSTSFYKTYLDHIEKALKQNESAGDKINELIKKYYNDLTGFETLKKLSEEIREVNLEPTGELVDELIHRAPLDSSKSISFLQFIFRMAPLVGSRAESFYQKDHDTYMMAWYRLDQSERININNRIIFKSQRKAIDDKDMSYEYRVANFCRTVNNPNFENGQRAYQGSLLNYYKGIKDSLNYLRSTASFFDLYYMTINVDSVQRADSITKSKIFASVKPQNANGNSSVFSFVPRAQFYASELNNGAWAVYTFTKDTKYLSKALTWAKRANEFSSTAEIMDTYARLLYGMGNIEVAKEWEQKAINMKKANHLSSKKYETVLEAMNKGLATIDEN